METTQVVTAALGLGDIAKIVLASGVVAAFIGFFKDWWFRRGDHRKAAKFAAIEIVGKLDQYAHQSSMRVSEYRELAAQLNPAAHYQNWPLCTYPSLEMSQDTLKCVDSDLACEVAWFATTQAHANEYVYYTCECTGDPTEAADAKAELVGFMGYEAFELASKLRKRYGLLAYAHRWELAGSFEDLYSDWVKVKNDIATRISYRKEAG
ncbi:hypothetical protein [Pseudomonas putida]|uniref:hypothetical protein n=1 Tax=Pseudomonas putida TaxID=303 RepID=UPI0005795147|nr:hypothetical protein [Pseudomonas putida]